MTKKNDALQTIKNLVGPKGWIETRSEMEPYLRDWRGLFQGAAAAVISPSSTNEIAKVLKICNQAGIGVVPQGGNTGLVGGGVPKNFIQDTVICAEHLGKDVEMHKYAVQITVADSRDGACSSSTLKEASSWGKVDITKEQMVFAEATSVLPLIASDAYHRGEWKNRDKKKFTKIFE